MSPTETTKFSPDVLNRALRPHLFPDEAGLNTFAVLDGASIPDLLDHLYGDTRPEFVCLYRGELEPDIAEVAPYLALLKPDTPFTDWLLAEGWGKHWGIFAVSPANLKAMRKHFRGFLMVKLPAGKQAHFRYYDPRVLRVYLPTCNAAETTAVFGLVKSYLCEDEKPWTMFSFRPGGGVPRRECIELAPPLKT